MQGKVSPNNAWSQHGLFCPVTAWLRAINIKEKTGQIFQSSSSIQLGQHLYREALSRNFCKAKKKPFYFAVEEGCKAWSGSILLQLPLRKAVLPEWRCCFSWDWSDGLRLLTRARVVPPESHHTTSPLMILLVAEAGISLVLFSHAVILQRQFQHWWILRVRSSVWIILSFQMTFSFCCLHQRQGILLLFCACD